MNREILFRGKRVDNGEWVYGYLVADTADCSLKKIGKCSCEHNGTDAAIYYWNDDLHEYDSANVIYKTVGEYVGMTDKNGTKIFEGDIVQHTSFPDEPAGIVWHETGFAIKGS